MHVFSGSTTGRAIRADAALFRRVLLVLLMASGVALSSYAQERNARRKEVRERSAAAGTIEGMVVEKNTGDPLPGATVAVRRAADSSLVSGAVSDVEGRFRIAGLRFGTYSVVVSFVGYTTKIRRRVRLSRKEPAAKLGKLKLRLDRQRLGELEVVAERAATEFRADRTVYNVGGQAVTLNASTAELLQTIPSIEVDVDGTLRLQGSEDVNVYIDGLPASLQGADLAAFLDQLPADMVERVEVITNPSARYDSDGEGGIVNIELDAEADLGVQSRISGGIGTDDFRQAALGLTMQRGRYALAANYTLRASANDRSVQSFRENIRRRTTLVDEEKAELKSNTAHVLRTNLKVKLTEDDVVTMSTLTSFRRGATDALHNYTYLDSLHVPTSHHKRNGRGNMQGLSSDYRLLYRHGGSSADHELTAGVRLSPSGREEDSEFSQELLDGSTAPPSTGPERQEENLDARNSNGSIHVDYQRPLSESTSVEAGAKGAFRSFNHHFSSELFNPNADAADASTAPVGEFVFGEQVYAAYGTIDATLGASSMKAGLRVEQTRTQSRPRTGADDADDARSTYLDVFPSLHYVLEPADHHKLRFSYSRRISRPKTQMLSPFAAFADPLNRFVANPFLEPEYTHKIELAYTYSTRLSTLRLDSFVRNTSNVMRRRKTVNEAGQLSTTYQNLTASRMRGIEFNLTHRFETWLRVAVGSKIHQKSLDGTNINSNLLKKTVSWSVRGNATVQSPMGITLQLSGFYNGPVHVDRGRISSRSSVRLAIQKSVLGDRGDLNLSIIDPFDTQKYRLVTGGANFHQTSVRRFNARALRIGFSYQLGRQLSSGRGGNQE